MSVNAWVQLGLFLAVLLAAVKPSGMVHGSRLPGATVRTGRRARLAGARLYRLAGVDPHKEMTWRAYAGCVLLFNAVGLVFLLCPVAQAWHPDSRSNPEKFQGAEPDLAFNTAVSFATNTNWQSYGGESTLSYLTQMLGLACRISCRRRPAWRC